MSESFSYSQGVLTLKGDWSLSRLKAEPDLSEKLAKVLYHEQGMKISVQGEGVSKLDTSGAWIFIRELSLWQQAQTSKSSLDQDQEKKVDFEGFNGEQEKILSRLSRLNNEDYMEPQLPLSLKSFFIDIGKDTSKVLGEIKDIFSFLGHFILVSGRLLKPSSKFPWKAISAQLETVGIRAIPIVTLIAFSIALVLGFQGNSQLERFGAQIFTVNLVGISVLREMGVLLTAIMLAGRSGSAFAAELGVMKLNEEVDALRSMGLDPFERLVFPRVMALVIALPLLTVLADIAGLLGGYAIAFFSLDLTLSQYIGRLLQAVNAKTFLIGIAKAPIFGLIIGVVGCMRGLEVRSSSQEVGRFTTISVVESIFLVILVDALISIFLTVLGL